MERTSWHAFDADSADPTICLPGEIPLVCEYRVVRPAVALWNYWASLAEFPKRGLSVDGVHPSWAVPADFTPDYLYYGMTNRNLTALQALDAVWRLVIEPGG